MSFFASVGIVILAMLILASLQLTPSVFTLFYHYALGKYSSKKASFLSLYFILGAETISVCLFLSSYYIANIFFLMYSRPESSILAWIAVGVLIALSIVCLVLYFRPGYGTKLFIPRNFAKSLSLNAKTAKSRSDAFVLGAFSNTLELILTIPLYLITSVELMELSTEFITSDILTICYILSSSIPLFVIRWRYQLGHNLADIEKSRIKDKTFTRFILGISYLVIAILIICFRINY